MNSVYSPPPAQAEGYFTYLPVALFGSTIGLSGLSQAWRLSHLHFGVPLWPAYLAGVLALLAFSAQSLAYLLKVGTAFHLVKEEFLHPVTGNLFGIPLMSMLLLPGLLAEFNLPLARAMWSVGAVGMMFFSWWTVSRWLHSRQMVLHVTPAWLVPVVGVIDVPLAMPALGLESQHGVMMLALSVGLFFAVPLLTMILSRLMFEEPMAEALLPSLLILVAPFAGGFLAYVATMGRIDTIAEAMFMLVLFMLSVLLARLRTLAQCCPFRVSWWAVSFPLAASASTALRYAEHQRTMMTDGIAVVLLALATVTIMALFARTVSGIARGELRNLK